MNELYKAIGTTKQNFHQRLSDFLLEQEQKEQLYKLIFRLRQEHPRIGAKKMYHMLNPQAMGRDAFISFYFESGFAIRRRKNYCRTTDSRGVTRFPNEMEGREFTGVNQAWVSDITYYDLNGRFSYLTFIMDIYSRKVKGWSASESLRTEHTTIPALKMAFKELRPGDMPVFHSDGGGQYYSREFVALTEGRFINSMCEVVYENAHAEKLNDTIKNGYLKSYAPQTFAELKRHLRCIVDKYNNERPHQSLNYLTPSAMELQSRAYPPKEYILEKDHN